ncbi:MAG: LacI family DNA-binding transcriptional regulator [Actinomycetaceae bacterium]|nr:LacI family DNA-binding transcriptional regulator [Actinomycetaceae bacterium]MDY6082502.1 LacI family DNA-binding transcriptional regulator [Actinomycetaceae bacterium]
MAGQENRGATRNDVAKLAGVSPAVVSYVINDGPRHVAPQTRQKVLDAIQKLHYHPNAAARALTTGRSDVVALVVPTISNPYFSHLAENIEREATEHGLVLTLGQASTVNIYSVLASFSDHGINDIITCTMPSHEALTLIEQNRMNCVNLSIPELPVGSAGVLPDYFAGASMLTRHLIDVHHHQDIALVSGSSYATDGARYIDQRELGWRSMLESRGLTVRPLILTDWSPEGGRQAARSLVDQYPDVTAVVVTSDLEAFGVMQGLREKGKRVPDDIAVVAFDATPEGAFMSSPLTSAGVSLQKLAARSIAQLLNREDRPRESLNPELILRQSCGCNL